MKRFPVEEMYSSRCRAEAAEIVLLQKRCWAHPRGFTRVLQTQELLEMDLASLFVKKLCLFASMQLLKAFQWLPCVDRLGCLIC